MLLDFAEQDFRDEISGDDKKHVNANKAARKPRFIRERMEDHHQKHSHRPQPVDIGAIALGERSCVDRRASGAVELPWIRSKLDKCFCWRVSRKNCRAAPLVCGRLASASGNNAVATE